MSRFQAVPYEDRSDVDLTSKLDVVFIMLVFFIVTATFVKEKGLSVDLPSFRATLTGDNDPHRG